MVQTNHKPSERATMLRSPLGRARGLGSTKSGHHHWWAQRLTAVALLPLTLWFIISLIVHSGGSYAQAVAWIGWPLNTILLMCLVLAGFYHISLGLQVIIEDYVHNTRCQLMTLVLMRGFVGALTVASVIAVLKIAFRA